MTTPRGAERRSDETGSVRAASPLDGVVVLDFSHVIAGPLATYYLAALGARVVKIENPQRGDSTRRKPHAFASLNHGKEIVAIDLATPEGRDRAWALFEQADVMVDNMRPGVLDRFGFGEAQARARKPSLIHCSISGYGRRGEWADRPAYDHVIQAASGMTLMAGEEGDGPIKVGFPAVDSITGILAALAIVAAIRRRDLTGSGESLDVSMLGAALQLMYPMTVDVMAGGGTPPRIGNAGYSGSPGASTVACADGLVALGANTPQQMLSLADVLGIRDRVEPLLGGQTRGFLSTTHDATLRGLLAEAARTRSASDLERRLNEVGVPAARVRDLVQCVREALDRDLVDSWTLPGDDATRVPGLGFRAETLFAGRSAPFGDTSRTPTERDPA